MKQRLTTYNVQQVGFSELDIEYVWQLLMTGESELAREKCGLSRGDVMTISRRSGYDNLVRRVIGEVFLRVLAPKAVKRLQEYAEKDAKPDRGQLDAMKTILDRIGFIAPKASNPIDPDMDMEDWSTDRLHKFLTEAEAVVSSRIAPNATLPKAQVIDVLD